MKFHSCLRFGLSPIISFCKTPWRCSSDQVKLTKCNTELLNFKNINIQKLSSQLNIKKIQKLDNICSVTIELNHVSWAKISIPTLTVMEWNAYELPSNLKKIKDHSVLLPLVKSIKEHIPNSEIYLVENTPKWVLSLNEIYMKGMLIMLLSFSQDKILEDKVIFQNSSVLNSEHKLLVGFERMSARPIVKNIFKFSKGKMKIKKSEIPLWYSKLTISEQFEKFFITLPIEKQESLSLALLLNLSWLSWNYFEKPKN